MAGLAIIEKNKNKILNAIVILAAIFIAFKIYNSQNQQIDLIVEERALELKKNKVIENISQLETKVAAYKKVFTKKDISSVMNSLSGIAKEAGIKIISVKPDKEEKFSDYIKSSFLLSIEAANYHKLGEFISKIENYKDLYLVEEIEMASVKTQVSGSFGAEGDDGLKVNLKISTIFYL